MAEIKILGNSMTIFSTLKSEEIRRVSNIAPEYTKLYEQSMDTATPEITYMVAVTPKDDEAAIGSVSKFGIVFDSTDEHGNAYLTMSIDRENGLDKDAIAEEFMPTMLKLNAVEARIKTALEGIKNEIETVKKDITVIG